MMTQCKMQLSNMSLLTGDRLHPKPNGAPTPSSSKALGRLKDQLTYRYSPTKTPIVERCRGLQVPHPPVVRFAVLEGCCGERGLEPAVSSRHTLPEKLQSRVLSRKRLSVRWTSSPFQQRRQPTNYHRTMSICLLRRSLSLVLQSLRPHHQVRQTKTWLRCAAAKGRSLSGGQRKKKGQPLQQSK